MSAQSRPTRWLSLIGLVALATALFGCASATHPSGSCAVLFLVNGQQIIPTPAQYAAIERKLSDHFSARRLILVPDLETAQFIATVELRSRLEQPQITDLVVRDLTRNSFVRRESPVQQTRNFPSFQQVEREQQKEMTRSDVR